jgi:hypothetical protein
MAREILKNHASLNKRRSGGEKRKKNRKNEEGGEIYFYLRVNISGNVQFRAGRPASPKRQTFVN